MKLDLENNGEKVIFPKTNSQPRNVDYPFSHSNNNAKIEFLIQFIVLKSIS